jgi:molybdopterin-synthase adenylyltransferase
MKYSVALTSGTNEVLRAHLLRADGQEDVCYALWHPGQGANRMTALVSEPILPMGGEREVHGNASTTGEYLGRVMKLAMEKGAGVVFLHSHPYTGWQDMSRDDVETELRQAPATKATTGMPLIGMTLGTDGAWSGRAWTKTAPKTYERRWCESVRVIGENGMEATFNDELLPPPAFREELKRTISAWGEKAQQKIARLTFGVIGVGSVGSVVAECLARMGVQHIKLIDYDHVERHNLDRLLHAGITDATAKRLKVDLIGAALQRSATAAAPVIERLPLSIAEMDGFKEALDCDILFSCVDRPWPRHVLNYIAYAYLIPVIDGGILIRMRGGRLRNASWRSHAVYPGKRCLQCIGQYDPDFVNVERRGDLDDPSYIENLPTDHALRRNENVFPFSTHLASSLIMHALHVALNPVGIADVGEHIYHFVDGTLDCSQGTTCYEGCYFPSVVAKGDVEGLPITGVDPGASKARVCFKEAKGLSASWFVQLYKQISRYWKAEVPL